MKKYILKKEDIERILTYYKIGTLINFKRLERRNENLQPGFTIKTTKGKFFLIQFWDYDYNLKKGMEFLVYLQKKKYPCVRIYKNKSNKPYVLIKGYPIAVFEYLHWKTNNKLTPLEAYELGRMLGRLHKISKNFPVNKKGKSGYDFFYNILKDNYPLRKKAPKRVARVAEYLMNIYPSLKVKKGEPKSASHNEFTKEHVMFKKGKIVKVIDFEDVSKEFMLYDLSTSMVECFPKGKINFNLLKMLIKGYESKRKLTKWEKEHLYEGATFGCSKFFLWGFSKEDIDGDGWPWGGTKVIEELVKVGKEKFQKEIKN